MYRKSKTTKNNRIRIEFLNQRKATTTKVFIISAIFFVSSLSYFDKPIKDIYHRDYKL